MVHLFATSPIMEVSKETNSSEDGGAINSSEDGGATELASNSGHDVENSLSSDGGHTLDQVHEENAWKKKSSSNALMIFSVLVAVAVIGAALGTRYPKSHSPGPTIGVPNNGQVGLAPVALTEDEYEARYLNFRAVIGRISNPTVFLDPASPQSKALDWIVYKDKTLATDPDEKGTVRAQQRYVMMVLYFTSGGSNWSSSSPYEEGIHTHECMFDGVICDSDDNIIVVELSRTNLSGNLPSEIGLLENLQILDLNDNFLQGPIPSSIGKLRELGELNLSFNEFTGHVPNEVGSLTKLTMINVYKNLLLSFPRITDLPNLKEFIVSFNELMTVNIADLLTHCPELLYAAAVSTRLTGTLPENIHELVPNMVTFDAYNTELTGSLPPSITSLTKLGALNIGDVEMEIPEDINKLSNLELLGFHGDKTSGTIPTTIGQLDKLKFLVLDTVDVTGTVPAELGNSASLEVLRINEAKLSGTFPSELGDIDSLREIEVIKTPMLSGTVPSSLCQRRNVAVVVPCSVECQCCGVCSH